MLLPQKSGLGLAALLLLAPLAAQAQAAAQPVPRTITVSSDAEVRTAPDRVTLQIGIQEEAKTLPEAQKRTNDQLRALDRVAKEMEIPADKMQTVYSSTQPKYGWDQKTNKRLFEGYNVHHQVSILLDKPDRLAALMEKITAAGIDEINNVQYGLQDEQKAKTDALKKAATNARAKAEQVATAMGEKLGKLLSLSDSGTNYQPMPMPMMRMAKAQNLMAADAAPNPPAGGITINSNVQATFALQD